MVKRTEMARSILVVVGRCLPCRMTSPSRNHFPEDSYGTCDPGCTSSPRARSYEVRLAGLPMQAASKAADPAVMDLSPHHTELVAPRVNHACAVRAASIDARGPECHQTLDFGVNS